MPIRSRTKQYPACYCNPSKHRWHRLVEEKRRPDSAGKREEVSNHVVHRGDEFLVDHMRYGDKHAAPKGDGEEERYHSMSIARLAVVVILCGDDIK